MMGANRSPKPREKAFRIGEREIIAIGVKRSFWQDFSHQAMTIAWPGFIAATALAFVLINALFALAYLAGNQPVSAVAEANFIQYFYFSIETLATVGYGDMHPQTHYGHILASLESFTGIFCIALMTGLIFARFSRPQARILFADAPVISTDDGKPVFMLRLANERHNAIGDATAKLWLLRWYVTPEGRRYRGFVEMKLRRNENPTFQLSWTLFHVMDESSPLFGMTQADMETAEAAFTVTINGLDENSAQTVHARKAYAFADLRWGHRYADILSTQAGRTRLDYRLFHDTEPEITDK